MDAEVPICTPPLYILYPVTPTVSVEAVHDRLICDEEIAAAESPVGVVGAIVSLSGVGVGVEATPTSPT